jgi:predicted nucleic-acid-binding Zn-ribbon protein
MRESKTAKSKCLNCGYGVDRASSVDPDKVPTPGALSICIRCGAVAAFDGKLALRGLTQAEIADIRGDRKLMASLAKVVIAIKFVQAQKAGLN